MIPTQLDVAVVGGGQSALAIGFYLRRSGLRYALFDEQPEAGAAWRRAWPSLRLFSPARWSSLPGWLMPQRGNTVDEYPSRDDVITYLSEYKKRYEIPLHRSLHVSSVRHDSAHGYSLETSKGEVRTRAVISATGSWANPVIPDIPGASEFAGELVHSAQYPGWNQFAGQRVVVVGGGNSGAQIFAELLAVADATWATREPPTFLPDEIDGRYLFEQATVRYKALQSGLVPDPPRSLGDIVMVPPVRDARDRGVLNAVSMFSRFTSRGVIWGDGREEQIDAVIFATGFRPALDHLRPLGVVGDNGRVEIRPGGSGTRSAAESNLWLVGYGEWTGFASATLIGVGRSARATVEEVTASLAAGSGVTG